MKYIKVELGGVNCTAYLRKAKKTSTYGDSITKCEFEFTKNVNDAVAITNALTVVVYSDENNPPTTKVFDGFIDLFAPQAGLIKITAKDQLALLVNKQIMHYYDKTVSGDPAYPDGKISKIFTDIIYTYGGLSGVPGVTIQDSGTEITLSNFNCRNADPFERARKLAETLNWIFYYKASDNYVYFESKNYTTNSTSLTVGVNIVEIPTWEYDRSEMINDLRLEGAQQLVQATQTFSGNASETTFTLSNNPEDLAVYYSAAKNYATTAKIASEIKIGDIENSISTHDYEVDKKNKTITFTSFTPASGTNNILVELSYYAPIPIHMIDDESIATYTTYAKTISLTDVITLGDAWKRAENILQKYKAPFKSAKLKVLWTTTLSLVIGQQIRVVDAINEPNIDQNFTIYKHIDCWPEAFDEIEVGDKQYTIEEYQANVLERLKRLEETMIGTTDAVSEIKQQTIPFSVTVSSMIVLVQNINDSFILGHPVNGVLGAGTCVGSWSFDEGSGTTANDATGNGHTGTLINCTWNSSSKLGAYCLQLDGAITSNAHGVTLGSPESTTTYTGFKITVPGSRAIRIRTNTKNASCTATKSYVYASNHTTLLSSATFSGNNASHNIPLAAGGTYYVVVGSDGAAYNKVSGSTTMPIVSSLVTWAAGVDSADWADNTTTAYSIASLSLDDNDYVTVTDAVALQPANLSISAWIYITSYPATTARSIVDRFTSSGKQGYGIQLNTAGTLVASLGNTSTLYTFTTAGMVPLNQWSHVAFTFDGTNWAIYINNVKETNVQALTLGYIAQNLQIGAHTSQSGFNGKIDEVKIYNTALTDAEVTELYNLRPASATSGIARLGWRGITASQTTYDY